MSKSSSADFWKSVLRYFVQSRDPADLVENHRLDTSMMAFGDRVHASEFFGYSQAVRNLEDEVCEQSSRRWLRTWRRNREYQKLIEKVSSRASERDIRYFWLKGATVLREELYPAGVRRLTDVDLLVKKNELNQWFTLFRELGYRPHRKLGWIEDDQHSEYISSTYFDGGEVFDIRIDLHWHLVDFPARRATGVWNWSMDPVWNETRDTTLKPERRLLYQADHAFTHSFRRWKWAVDLVMLEREYDLRYELLREEAERWNLCTIIGITKAFVDNLLSTEWLDEFPGINRSELNATQKAFVRNGLNGENDKADYLMICASLLSGIRERARFFRWILFPPTSALSDLPSPPGPIRTMVIYARRVFEVLLEGFKTFFVPKRWYSNSTS